MSQATGDTSMTAAELKQVKAIFAEALEKSGNDRAAFLEQACAGDPGLRGEVDAFLAAAGRAGDFLDAPTAGPSASGSLHGLVGSKVGPYKLLQLIGEGGFGTGLHGRADSTRSAARSR